MVVTKPYTQDIKGNVIIREFSDDVDSQELVWHRDKKDRKVRVLESNGWLIQFDEEMPIQLEENKEYFVPKNVFHRVIKGTGLLRVEIEEICPCKNCGCDKMKI